MIDYKELLKKYIALVVYHEGTEFLTYRTDGFTDEEWQALQDLSREMGYQR